DDSGHTRPNTPVTSVQHPTNQQQYVLAGKRQRGRSSRKAQRKPPPSESGLYLPIWSIILMLVIVLIIAFGIVFLIISLGGKTPTQKQPRIVVITAVPSPTTENIIALPQITPTTSDQGIAYPLPTFALEGPTLEPVYLSPTPETIAVGKTVRVFDVAPDQLNIRNNPGTTDSVVLFRADDGAQFIIIGGPTQADGLTWWQVQNPVNPAETGWAAANYLEVVPQ
ncbi:MAG: SH3 domain-containing protein, partial [Chloroflexi bacterium]